MGRTDQIGAQLAESTFEWDVVPPPSGPAGFRPSKAQNGIAAWADAPNAELAAQFVVPYVDQGERGAVQGLALCPQVPPEHRRRLRASPSLTREQLERSLMPVLQAEDFVFEYSHPNYAPIERNANLVYDGEVWVEGADIQQALTDVCTAVQPLMAP